MSHMKSFNNNISIIALFWFLIQGIILVLNNVRVYFEYGHHPVDNFFIAGCFLITMSSLLLINNRIISVSVAMLLFLYSVFTIFFMGLLFLLEARNMLFAIFVCFVIPVLNTVFSFVLIRNTLIKRRSRDLTKH
mgnify:CR=1 FL=1